MQFLAAFAMSWTPYWGYTLLNFRSESTGTDAIWVIIQNLAPLNSAADPLIYAFFTTNLWKEFRFCVHASKQSSVHIQTSNSLASLFAGD